MKKFGLLVSFTDSSRSFVNGCEYGRILEKMERGENIVMNNGLPIHVENREVIEKSCTAFGYIPTFGIIEGMETEWVQFMGLKKVSNDN